MHVETRVGNYPGNIENLAKQYSDGFFSLPLGRQDVHKCGLFMREEKDSYLLMISNCDTPCPDYNTIVTVFGPNEQRVTQIMHDFESNVDVEIKEAPDYLKEQNEYLMKLFKSLNF